MNKMSSGLPQSLSITSISSSASNTGIGNGAASCHTSLPAGALITGLVTVKQERHDEAEIREMAAKILETNKTAMAKQAQQQQQQTMARQIALNLQPGKQPGILNYFQRNGAAQNTATVANGVIKAPSPESSSSGEKKTCDEESQKGHFGWATFSKIHIPYIARQAEKYCAVRMVEMKLLNKYLNYLHPDIYSSCTCVRSYYITEAESRLLNEINHKHCDAQFGRDLFTTLDLVVRLSDANKFYQFLDICYRKLMTGSKSPSDKCGFIRINKESVVPYTVRNGEQVVPLFYFEGETENLRQKADYLSGWDLAYLKFCCKVQGIRNELFSSESVAVISLTDIKSYFPNGTEFEDYWPSKVVDSSLLVASKNLNSSIHWTRQPSHPPPKVLNSCATTKAIQQQQHPTTIRKNAPNYPSVAQKNAGNVAAAQRIQAAALMSQGGMTAAAVQALTNGWAQGNQQTAIPPGMLTHAQNEVYRSINMAAQQALGSKYHVGRTSNTSERGLAKKQPPPTAAAMLRAVPAKKRKKIDEAHGQQPTQRTYSTSRNQMQNLMATRQQQAYNYGNSGMSMAPMNCAQTQQPPPPLVRLANQNQAHMLNSDTSSATGSPSLKRSISSTSSCDPTTPTIPIPNSNLLNQIAQKMLLTHQQQLLNSNQFEQLTNKQILNMNNNNCDFYKNHNLTLSPNSFSPSYQSSGGVRSGVGGGAANFPNFPNAAISAYSAIDNAHIASPARASPKQNAFYEKPGPLSLIPMLDRNSCIMSGDSFKTNSTSNSSSHSSFNTSSNSTNLPSREQIEAAFLKLQSLNPSLSAFVTPTALAAMVAQNAAALNTNNIKNHNHQSPSNQSPPTFCMASSSSYPQSSSNNPNATSARQKSVIHSAIKHQQESQLPNPSAKEVIDLSSPRRSTAAAAAAANAMHQQQQQQQQQQQHQQQQQQQHQQHQQVQQHHHQQQRATPNSMQQNGRSMPQSAAATSAAMHLQRQASATSQMTVINDGNTRLCVIPEIPVGSVHVPPYKVQKVFVENLMVPCINMKAYNDSDQLLTLADFREFFFPNVPLEQCKRYFEALGVDMFKGNRRQIQALIDFGKPHSDNVPLIQIRDVLKFMPQLRYMMRGSILGQEQPPNKRTRIS